MPETVHPHQIQNSLESARMILLARHQELLTNKVAADHEGDRETAAVYQDVAEQVSSACDHLVNAQDELKRHFS